MKLKRTLLIATTLALMAGLAAAGPICKGIANDLGWDIGQILIKHKYEPCVGTVRLDVIRRPLFVPSEPVITCVDPRSNHGWTLNALDFQRSDFHLVIRLRGNLIDVFENAVLCYRNCSQGIRQDVTQPEFEAAINCANKVVINDRRLRNLLRSKRKRMISFGADSVRFD